MSKTFMFHLKIISNNDVNKTIIIILLDISVLGNLSCHLCSGVTDPQYCVHVAQCQAGEVCY